jgi:hypothetical protein
MQKAARPSSGMDSSNPHRYRGEWLHYGDVVCRVVVLLCCCCAFCAISSGRHISLYVDKYERITLGRVIDETKCPTQACTIPGVIFQETRRFVIIYDGVHFSRRDVRLIAPTVGAIEQLLRLYLRGFYLTARLLTACLVRQSL